MIKLVNWHLRRLVARYKKTFKSSRREKFMRAYLELNKDAPDGVMVFREGLSFNLEKDSWKSYEHFCYINPPMVDEIDGFLKHARHCRSLLDIGALHGVFSLAFTSLNPENRSLAVDASPAVFEHLNKNIALNPGLAIESIECALSDSTGTLKMHTEWQHAIAAGTPEEGDNVISVEMKSGDSLCAEKFFIPDMIKIDVEGHEVKVLRGLKEIISTHRPTVFLELHYKLIASEGDSIDELVDLFCGLGYSLETIEGLEVPLHKMSSISRDERFILLPPVAS